MPHAPADQPPDEKPQSGVVPHDSAAGGDFILPGGKLDPDALRAAFGDSTSEDEESGLPRVTFKLQRDLDKRLDKYLTDRITFMSRSQLQRLIDDGGVTVNGRRPKAATKLRIGDEVMVVVPPPPVTEIQPENIPIEVLFEDEHILVLNKSPDIIVHPARSHNTGTLVHALAWHFQHNSPKGGGLSTVGKEFARPGIVHRLDRHTSGVMVAAKTDEAHWKLGRQFELRQTDKRYIAIVEGLIEADADVIEHPIGPSPSKAKGQREKMVVRHDEMGKHAVTIYRVRQRFGPVCHQVAQSSGQVGAPLPPHLRPDLMAALTENNSGEQRLGEDAKSVARSSAARMPPPKSNQRFFTLVELELKTGRTHQIRVHLSHMGFPIVGDDLYGGHHATPEMLGPAAPRATSPRATTLPSSAKSCSESPTTPDRATDGRLRTSVPSQEETKQGYVIARQALHAAMLTFVHPITNEKMTFTAPLRSDMAETLAILRSRGDAGAVMDMPGAVLDMGAMAP